MQKKSSKILIKIARVLGWIVVSVITLLLVVIAVIQIPAVQKKLTQKAITFLEEKIGTEVDLEGLYISFPKNVVVTGLYLEDQSHDTLLYAGKLSINTDLWALTKKTIALNKVRLSNTTAFVKRSDGDTLFNYSYILKAFAGDSTAVPDTLEEEGWNFKLKAIELENIRAQYQDALTGNFAGLNLGEFEMSLDEFDLEKYRFSIEDVRLENTTASVVQTKIPEVTVAVAEESTDTMKLNLDFDEIILKNVNLRYSQQQLGQEMRADIGEIRLKANKIDLQNNLVDLNKLTLNNSLISWQQHDNTDNRSQRQVASRTATNGSPKAGSPPSNKKDWRVRLKDLSLVDNSIQFYDFTKATMRDGLDFNRLWVTNLKLSASDLGMEGSLLRADLNDFSFNERSGFALKNLSADLDIADDSATIRNFLLETGQSKIRFDGMATYESITMLADNFSEVTIRANIDQSSIGLQDILYFSPSLFDSIPLNVSPEVDFYVDASVAGQINDILIHHLNFNTLSATQLNTSGKIAGLPDPDRLALNITVDKFYTTVNDVTQILPDTLLPDSLVIPEWININSEYKGNLETAAFETTLTTNIGSVRMNGNMDLDSASVTRGFDGNVEISEFNLGALLNQPETIGKLNLLAAVHSDGLVKDEMNSALEATINSFGYNGYNYENLKVNATLRDDILKGWVSLPDSNLSFTLNGHVNFQEEVPNYNFTLDLRNADFKALALSQRPLKARGTLDVNMATADMRVLNGSLGIRKVAIFNGDDLYAIDSLLFASIDQEGRSEIKIDSDLLTGRFEGSINIFTMPAVLREYFNTYYSLHDSVEQSYEAPQHFSFNLDLKKTELITDILVPELEAIQPGELKGEFDSEEKKLNIRFDLADIQYSNVGVTSFLFSTNSDSTRLNYNILIDEVMIDSMRIDGLEFNGTVADDSIRTNVVVRDSLDYYKYMIGGTFFSRDTIFELTLNPEQILLNYQSWDVPASNYIRFGKGKPVIDNVTLTSNREQIIVQSKPDASSPLFIGFRELNLEYLTSMIAAEKPASGLLNGDINIFFKPGETQFTADIKINELAILQYPWGDISLSVEQKVTDRFDVHFLLAGKQNDVRMDGFYEGGESQALDLSARINRFNLGGLQPLLTNQAEDIKGNLSGQFTVLGSPQDPDVNGFVQFSGASFFSKYLRSAFSIKEDRISFNEQGIRFTNFELADVNNNIASLDGLIRTDDYRDFRFALSLKTKDFQLLNTTADDNDLFYGRINLNADAQITGTLINPVVDVVVSLTDGDHLTYIVPQSEASVLQQQGIVRFVDKTFKGDPFIKKIQPELEDTVKTTFSGIDLTAKVELTDQESLTIVIDPTTNDQLTVKGNSTLTLQIDRTGDMQLSGRYEISEGTYNLSFYKFVKREFEIEKGSVITWTGDMLDAAMDIHAIYRLETAPIELLANQITGSEELNRYRQRLPFLVYLDIGGQLLNPEISFRLDMPMDQRNALGGNVYARLQDINTRESDLNKQVFALLILKRFVSDNPFENQAGNAIENTARTSVSKILTAQLNKLSENIKGVELSFDVKSYEDYSTGEGEGEGQTELQLGLSKRLFNDRLIVRVAGNLDIEGQNTNRDVTDYIGDIALEYVLTEDGRFRITGFRTSDYDMIDGELIETGTGLIYVKDYNSFRELFRANAKEDE